MIGRMHCYKAKAFIFVLVEAILLQGFNLQTLIAGPKNSTVLINSTVTLTCQFNGPVYCTWQRNRMNVDIWTNYKYVKWLHQPQYDATCTIKIVSVQQEDLSSWVCLGSDKEKKLAVSSEPAYLTLSANSNANLSGPNTTDSNSNNVLVFVIVALVIGAAAIGLTVAYIKLRIRFKKMTKGFRDERIDCSTAEISPRFHQLNDVMEHTYSEITYSSAWDSVYSIPYGSSPFPEDNATKEYMNVNDLYLRDSQMVEQGNSIPKLVNT